MSEWEGKPVVLPRNIAVDRVETALNFFRLEKRSIKDMTVTARLLEFNEGD